MLRDFKKLRVQTSNTHSWSIYTCITVCRSSRPNPLCLSPEHSILALAVASQALLLCLFSHQNFPDLPARGGPVAGSVRQHSLSHKRVLSFCHLFQCFPLFQKEGTRGGWLADRAIRPRRQRGAWGKSRLIGWSGRLGLDLAATALWPACTPHK